MMKINKKRREEIWKLLRKYRKDETKEEIKKL